MLDMNWIKENTETLRSTATQKNVVFPLDELLAWEDKRRSLLQETEQLRAKRNALTKEVEQWLREGNRPAGEAAKERVREINSALTGLETGLAEAEQRSSELMLLAPNPVSLDTPVGRDDSDNVELRRVGTPPEFDFTPRDHVELGELHDILDIPRGVKAGGPRSYVLKGAGLYLHLAVQRLALDVLTERGFTVMDVPVIVRPETLQRTGFFPGGMEQTYELNGENRWLAGTSEVSLVSLYSDEIVDLDSPLRIAGMSTCFRREVGSAGRDVRGLYRVHQFSKIEQVILCRKDAGVSESLLQEITANAEYILELLELPYRVVAVCTGDMALKTHKQYDIETWMPSRGAYGETHSASNLLDFQARRSGIRYRDYDGRLQYCHTLNNTAVATPRILIPLLENHQQEDGSIYIPQALRKYMDGQTQLIL
ncbi:serine--tRNA ligase [Paenibacillus sp. NPDC057934]|uniref:serine--tRNA ligase n=1 Tax=Paenibacillus sp. NPDC057934 TaxID=3346282 RepID=UPI0036D9B184